MRWLLLLLLALTPALAADVINPSTDQSVLTTNKGQLPGTATNDNAAAGNVGEYSVSNCVVGTTATVTITIATPGVITWSGNPFTTACPVVFTTSGALPTGLTSGTTYYVAPSSVSGNNFSVSTTVANALAGTLIATSGTQSGTQTGTAGTALTSGAAADITGLSLTAGDWDLRGQIANTPAGSTNYTLLISSISTTSATPVANIGNTGRTDCGDGAGLVGGSTTVCIVGSTRVSLSATSNVFLVVDNFFSVSTMIAGGAISARRVR